MTIDAQPRVPMDDVTWREAPTSLYVHIPFCASRCFYCDFTTYVAPESAMEAYTNALIAELQMLANGDKPPLRTVFFGGGTPTLLKSHHLNRILETIRGHFDLTDGYEMTMEANPGTVDAEKLRIMADGGVNRVSFGAQTFNPRLLMTIGRSHDVEAIEAGARLAKQSGITRLNVDLMFGLPEQSLTDVEESIESLLKLNVEHVSAYWLKVEEGTPFGKWQGEGLLPLPGEDEEGDMYDLVRDRLKQAGYVHYEVSNFARAGGESRHNLVYWHNEPYLAAGVGAHGLVGGVRYENVKSLKQYAQALSEGHRPYADSHTVSRVEACEDTMMLGLRLREGVGKVRFLERHGVPMETLYRDQIDELMSKGMLRWSGDALQLTEAAWPIANVVFEQFVGLEA